MASWFGCGCITRAASQTKPLCGGCRQLGPVLHSTPAEGHGLKTSLLEAFVQYHATQQQHYADLGLAPCLGTLQPMPMSPAHRITTSMQQALRLCGKILSSQI